VNVVALMMIVLAAAEQPIDDFSYTDADAAREVWVAAPGTPPVEVGTEEGRRHLTLSAPFAADKELSRAYIDRRIALDLSAVGEFTLELDLDVPEAVAHLTLYFRSGDGWYGATGHATRQGWHTIRFSKASFRSEGTPAGWGRIDAIRLAAWRGQAKDATLRLRRLAAASHEIALVVPESAAASRDREVRSALAVAERVAGMLADLGLGADVIEEPALSTGALGRRPVAVLAYNPRLSAEAAAALEGYVDRGGKLFVCYTLPARLAAVLGFGPGRYVQQSESGQFAEIRFDATQVAGLPESVKQASWNITDAAPASPNVHHATVAGRWYDAEGNATGRAALLLSDRGAFFSHIVLPDDREGKRQMLAAVLGQLHPPLWKKLAAAALERVGRVGHCEGLEQVHEYVQTHGGEEAIRLLREADTLLNQAQAQSAAARCWESVATARLARERLIEAYCKSQPSPHIEARAIWNHSGTGAYPGDWERSCKLLAESGLNMVLPNMLWGGVAHYPSDVLPRSSTYEQYGDQIAQCVAAAHKYGIEVHVWKVNWNLGAAPASFKEKLRREGRLQRGYDGDWENWLCPSHPENQKLELESMIEVARKYPVDGLHFDYIRYPGEQECYCDGCRERFEADSGRRVESWPEDCYRGPRKDEYRDWRCRQITTLVAAVHREAKRLRPEIKLSAAVFGSYPDCRRSVGQDWVAWVRAGYLDFLCPMDYTTNDLRFTNLVENQLRLVEARVPVYPGIGAWRLEPDRVVGQIYHARRLGAPGFTIFNFQPDAARALLPAIALGAGSEPAKPPHQK